MTVANLWLLAKGKVDHGLLTPGSGRYNFRGCR